MGMINFLDEDGTFTLHRPENYSGLYFPIAQDMGIKSAVTPNLGGDAKVDQNTFLLEPVSIENLNNNRGVRNFWCKIDNAGVWSAVGASALQESVKFTSKQDDSNIEAGFMWHKMTRTSTEHEIMSEVISFAPVDCPVEIMYVTITNRSDVAKEIIPTAAIPIYGRSADNIRDHRHVTSLLHRIKTNDFGVCVKPTLSFDERGHRKNELTYFVCGVDEDGNAPEDFYPVLDTFMGEGGSLTSPRTIIDNTPGVPSGTSFAGKEAMGGLHFSSKILVPGESMGYTIIMGVLEDDTKLPQTVALFDSGDKVMAHLQKTKDFWKSQVNVSYKTGNDEFDGFMKWVSFQPFLRRIFGCSFLPHHDYGRGGRGWRDLWQDCLSLLIMDPSGVRQMILDNYCGVRIDGTNATIIGEKQGEFVADRNGIARVWMDHGMWPFLTTKLYINQTGDVDVLKEKATYFKDEQKERGTALDREWTPEYGVRLRKADGEIYEGTILEHILLEQLCSFYEVGAHNHMRLRGADWNDALDMAAENGESVAFTAAYAGNLEEISRLLITLADKYGWEEIELLEEINDLLNSDSRMYDSIDEKKAVLAGYLSKCGHVVSGNMVRVDIRELADNLKHKADWIKNHIRSTEWIDGEGADDNKGWFNSYYDDNCDRVEGYFPAGVRMMLTGQVFTIMSNTATDEQVKAICESADKYLYKREAGGYRLNTDFNEVKLNLGRMFGFAYGEKENGAVFSHMTVMYANALYQRGFAREGYKALSTLSEHAMDFNTSKIYPGIPEYFDADGRGLYHYLTGAASWYMLTFITEVFGVKGVYGDLAVSPKLVVEQFDESGNSTMTFKFAGKEFKVVVSNPEMFDYGQYRIVGAECDGRPLDITDGAAMLRRSDIETFNNRKHTVKVILGR